MKKLILTTAVLFSGVIAFAQNDTMPVRAGHEMQQTHDMGNQQVKPATEDGLLMKEDKLWVIKAGKKDQVSKPVKLENGTMVMIDGTVKAKDGTTMKLKNGDWVSMDGRIVNKPELLGK